MGIKALLVELGELLAGWCTPEVELLPQRGRGILDHSNSRAGRAPARVGGATSPVRP